MAHRASYSSAFLVVGSGPENSSSVSKGIFQNFMNNRGCLDGSYQFLTLIMRGVRKKANCKSLRRFDGTNS
jgi:hypothetical protein